MRAVHETMLNEMFKKISYYNFIHELFQLNLFYISMRYIITLQTQ